MSSIRQIMLHGVKSESIIKEDISSTEKRQTKTRHSEQKKTSKKEESITTEQAA